MPKLSSKDRKKVANAESVSGEFEAWPAGKYIAELSEVEVRKSQRTGDPMWNVEFVNIYNLDGEKMPGRQWYTLMLPIDKMPANYKEDAGLTDAQREEKWEQYQSLTAGRLSAFFDAFGYTEDTDTDEMLGEKCLLTIGVETAQGGKKAGQKVNRVNGISKLTDDLAGIAGGDEDDDNF